MIVQRFISERFAATYGAQVISFMPRLFSLRGKQRELIGALGLRSAHETLFLERYLDSPVETAISNLVGTAVERHHVVEVGQFTGISAGSARTMIRHLTNRLY